MKFAPNHLYSVGSVKGLTRGAGLAHYRAMKTARLIFAIAAIYGLVVLVPGLFTEAAFNLASPPAINHPEFY